ncbi:hypothetical protein TNCV_4731931 [Trichonephila clavipes]|nr:hypothetical protein TNCV_4731931 [Trichonephila clavipes]
MFRKRRGQQEMSWATIVDFYARLREVTEIIGSHHDKLLGGPDLLPRDNGTLLNKNIIHFFQSQVMMMIDDEVPFVDDEDGDPHWEEF